MYFNELDINKYILKALEELGYEECMPIQQEAIPYILEGNDVIGQAETGTGKTAAFGIPLINNSTKNNEYIEHLIVSPTRELATQIKKELETLAKYTNIKIGLILGGNSYYEEKKMLKSIPNIIVATPGRLLDHIKSNKIDISHVKSLTLDEADEMLDIGFKEELTEIIAAMPEGRQGLLFSATLNEGVKDIARKLLHNPKEILVSSGLKVSESITQYAVIVDEKDKLRILLRYLQINNPKSAIIFGRTKKRVDELSKALSSQGFRARGLHGDLTQNERNNVMDSFRNGETHILVATDVAARGIHVNNVEVVYNFDLPQDIEYYVHRIGRTGRANEKGVSFSFVRPEETAYLSLIEHKTKGIVTVLESPSNNNVKRAKREYVKSIMEEACDGPVPIGYYDIATDLIERFGAERALSAALQLLMPKRSDDSLELSTEPPVYVKLPKKYDKHSKSRRDNKKTNHDHEHKHNESKDFKKNNHKRGSSRVQNSSKRYKNN